MGLFVGTGTENEVLVSGAALENWGLFGRCFLR